MRTVARVLVAVSAVIVLGLLAIQYGWLDGITQAPAPAAAPAAASGIPSDATEAVVEYVHDGDTLFLEDGRKVRMLGINTPEIGENLECYGDEATAVLRGLLPEGSHVWVQQDVEPLDQYGRSLLFVWTSAGELVNYSLVQGGYAEAVFIGQNTRWDNEFEGVEEAAQDAGAGIWGAC